MRYSESVTHEELDKAGQTMQNHKVYMRLNKAINNFVRKKRLPRPHFRDTLQVT